MFQSLFYWTLVKNSPACEGMPFARSVSILVLLDFSEEPVAQKDVAKLIRLCFNPCFIGL